MQTPVLRGDPAAPEAPLRPVRRRTHALPTGRQTPPDRETRGVIDQVVPFVTALRWASLALGLLLLTTDGATHPPLWIAAGAVLVGNTVWRTLRPLDVASRSGGAIALVLVDLAIVSVAVALSGRAASPFLLTPIPTLALVGFGWGNRIGIAAAAVPAIAVLTSDLMADGPKRGVDEVVQVGLAFIASAAIGGLVRRLSVEAAEHEQETRDQMARMATANDLLLALHRVAQMLPASLDLGDVVTSARDRFRQSFEYTDAAVLVRDETNGGWRTEWAEGVRLPHMLDDERLPEGARALVDGLGSAVVQDLFRSDMTGCSPSALSGLYGALRTPRGTVVGVVVIEHTDPDRYGERDVNRLEEIARPLALAIDNALWFGRLRVLAAEAERARIARDLHDRLAQSLGYIAFELERLSSVYAPAPQIEALHEVVRDVVVELRETLQELRATITESVTLADIARGYLGRLEARTGIETHLILRDAGRRLPIQVEQEIWRIAQEALANVERHSGADEVRVIWTVNGGRARLEVRDDGRGFRAADIPADRFGIVGMRERASAIRAHLAVDGEPGTGTQVLLWLEVPT